jgi:hypothetical protein
MVRAFSDLTPTVVDFGHYVKSGRQIALSGASLLSGLRLCGPVVRVSGCRYRGSGLDSRSYEIF